VEVNDEGLVIERKGKKSTLPVDTVVVCAGQEPLRELYESFDPAKSKSGTPAFLIGGAQEAGT
jgi:2,4-dienoyl-CoA reductase (NADPH2)